MKVKKFWVKGYRSLRDVTLEGLGDFNIFYGPNGSGKSNILDALQTFFTLMPLAVDTAYGGVDERPSFRQAGSEAAAKWIGEDDFFAREDTQSIVMGAEIEGPDNFATFSRGNEPVERVQVEIHFWRRPGGFNLRFKHLFVNGQWVGLPFADRNVRDLLRGIVPDAFAHLGVTRTLAVNAFGDASASGSRRGSTIPDGEVVRELFAAKNSSDLALRRRYHELREFVADTLHRPEFDVFIGSNSGLELRERLPEPNPLGRDIRVDRAGHGVVQMYAIVASILLARGRLVAIEEPEAHLHAPTLGRELRGILQKMMEDGRVEQFFIATHSNLFDLDLTGYWDVSLANGETVVQRKPLDEVDRVHLYEPGPAKHQLQEMLRLFGDEVVFRTGDGQKLTATEMLAALQNDEDVAKAFLESLHAAAMQVTGLRAKRAQGTPK
ncbi:AAA family ATPase [Nannocystis punicea]|uniref:AAA family ATPase n=1 Tax=Nannocystis punicea TaxID=2995304 RepID=A0ABY7GYH1_9BACT|nr:ATP-binding protein [Nannocystis poenicansa]WAS91909.1 AAA family ATPase [Nannocystis poenicansa]